MFQNPVKISLDTASVEQSHTPITKASILQNLDLHYMWIIHSPCLQKPIIITFLL